MADTDTDGERSWSIGDTVRDRDDDDDPDPAIVVNRPPQTVDEWIAYTNTTVAEDNPEYPADAPVVVVVFEDRINEARPDWDRNSPLAIADLDDDGIYYYAFPAPRLEAVDATSDDPDPDPDPDPDSDLDPEAAVDSTAAAGNDPETGAGAETAAGPETESADEPAEPSAAVHALAERLAEGGMSTEIEADGQTVRASKLGETYRVQPGEVIEGDGALRGRLEEIVAGETEQQATD